MRFKRNLKIETGKLDLTPLWLKLQTVKGVYAYGMGTLNGEVKPVFAAALDLIAQHTLRTEPLVTHQFALEDYCRMIEVNLDKGSHQAIKTVVTFT